MAQAQTGILLVNLGTPSAASVPAVKAYLREFLCDPQVIDLPNPFRSLLVNGLIVPLRAKSSTHAYQQVWTERGAPLLVYTRDLQAQVQVALGDTYKVAIGMNYGEPSIAQGLAELEAAQCQKIIVLPLFPQYSSAVTESIRIKINKLKVQTPLHFIEDFFQAAGFIDAWCARIQPVLNNLQPERLLLSYHGLPMRQLYKTSGAICKSCPTLASCPSIQAQNAHCYRAQCYQTSARLAQQLDLGQTKLMTSFQSRLGRLTWTQPYTESTLDDLATQGVKRLAVACPAFVTDCLETIEEIGLRAKAQWFALGGEAFELVPCLNDEAGWVKDLIVDLNRQ